MNLELEKDEPEFKELLDECVQADTASKYKTRFIPPTPVVVQVLKKNNYKTEKCAGLIISLVAELVRIRNENKAKQASTTTTSPSLPIPSSPNLPANKKKESVPWYLSEANGMA